jgi:serine/threonine-protein kinase
MHKLSKDEKFCPVCGCKTNIQIFKSALSKGYCLNNRYTIDFIIEQTDKTIKYIAIDEDIESKIAIVELFPNHFVSRLEDKVLAKNYKYEIIFKQMKDSFLIVNKILKSLRSIPNILTIYDFFEDNNTVYVVQEISKGITFEDYLANNYGEISWDQSKNMFLDLVKLLDQLHSRNIIHSDLTPKTLFVESNILKIINFNNAQYNHQNNFCLKLNDGYSAPEQYENKEINRYTDVYSIAAIMYKSLTGTKPVISTSRISNDNLLPPNILNPNISKNISFAIMSALILAPKLRTQTMQDFYEDLTAKPREMNQNHHISSNTNLKRKDPNKIKKSKLKNTEIKTKKQTKMHNIVFTSLLISCAIISFFLIITIFFLFSNHMFE